MDKKSTCIYMDKGTAEKLKELVKIYNNNSLVHWNNSSVIAQAIHNEYQSVKRQNPSNEDIEEIVRQQLKQQLGTV